MIRTFAIAFFFSYFIADELAAANISEPLAIRRLFLHATGRLPTSAEQTSFAALDQRARIDELLTTSEGLIGLSSLLATSLAPSVLSHPDLDRFIASGNSTLAGSLTDEIRSDAQMSTLWNFHEILSGSKDLSQLFQGSTLKAAGPTISLFGLSQGSDALTFQGRVIYDASYADTRPAIGLLATPWLWTSLDSDSSQTGYKQLAALNRKLLCTNDAAKAAHDYSGLDLSSIGTGLRGYANANSPCSGCHGQTATLSSLTKRLHSGSNFSDWLEYSPSTVETTAMYFGHQTTSLTDWAQKMAADPRVALCLAKNLYTSMNHRGFVGARDDQTILLAQHLFSTYDQSLTYLIRGVFAGESFATAPITESSGSRFNTTGLRFLGRREWVGIANQFITDTSTITFPLTLNPAIKTPHAKDNKKPSGPYWHAANRTARQIAEAIISAELKGGVSTESRKLFSALPAGTAESASAESIQNQIQLLWLNFTAETIDSSNENFLLLQALFNTASDGNDTAEKSKQGWKSVLIATLLSRQFLAY